MRNAGLAATVTALAVLLLSVSGCSDARDDYCAALRDEQQTLDQLSARAGDRPTSLTEKVAVFERLQGAAPEDLGDEWASYVNAWRGLVSAIEDTGVDASAFDGDGRPEGVEQAAYDAVRDAADRMRSRPVVDAALGIEQHATDVCGVDLDGGGL